MTHQYPAGGHLIIQEQFDQDHTITLGSQPGAGRVLKPGDIVGGSYRLKTIIGRGGMGYVFCAEHTMMRSNYALKILAPEQLNEVSWKRFESEGRAIAALDHVNIVKVYNMGIDAGDCPFYVMDLLQGDSLADRIKSGKGLDFYQVIDIFMQIARGLEYAHQKGTVHRDVKPSNVVLVPDDKGYLQVKLVDFGIAKLIKDSEKDQRLTATGQIFGTPFYMSPEQCLGQDVDHRTDIYSLGCALFETLSGQPPFRGVNAMDTVLMHLNKTVPSCADVCPGEKSGRSIDSLIGRMMTKNPHDRYPSMAEVSRDLERIRENKTVGRSNIESIAVKNATKEVAPEVGVDVTRGGRPAGIGLSVLALAAICSIGIVFLLHESKISPGGGVDHSRLPSKNSSNTVPALKPVPNSIPTVTNGDGSIDLFEKSKGWLDSPEVAKAGADYALVRNIAIANIGGHSAIKFPRYSIGRVKIDGMDREAEDTILVPPSARLGLVVDWDDKPFSLAYPEIFRKVEPTLFNTLEIDSVGLSHLLGGTRSDALSFGLLTVLEAATKWTQLDEVKLGDFARGTIDDKVLGELDKIKGLKRFNARGGQIDAKVLTRHNFVLRLRHLDLDRTGNIDLVLDQLGQSKQLQILWITETRPTVAGLHQLATCPRLNHLALQGCPLTREHLIEISKLPALRKLDINDNDLYDDGLSILSKSKSLTDINIRNSRFPPDKQAQLKQAYRQLKFMDN